MRPGIRRSLAAALALGLLAAACGDDADSADGDLGELVEVEGASDAPVDETDETDDDGSISDDDAEQMPSGPVATAPVEVDGEPLPAVGGGSDDPAVGELAPTLSGTSVDGEPMEIRPGDGPTIVMFLAHWCPHCQNEVPVVVDWLDDGRLPDDVDLVAVSTAVSEPRGNFPPSEWLESEGWTVPTLADDDASTALQAYGLGSFPYFVALDADGRVVARVVGEQGADGLDQLVGWAQGSNS